MFEVVSMRSSATFMVKALSESGYDQYTKTALLWLAQNVIKLSNVALMFSCVAVVVISYVAFAMGKKITRCAKPEDGRRQALEVHQPVPDER